MCEPLPFSTADKYIYQKNPPGAYEYWSSKKHGRGFCFRVRHPEEQQVHMPSFVRNCFSVRPEVQSKGSKAVFAVFVSEGTMQLLWARERERRERNREQIC